MLLDVALTRAGFPLLVLTYDSWMGLGWLPIPTAFGWSIGIATDVPPAMPGRFEPL